MNIEIPSQTAVVDLDVTSFRYGGERKPVLRDLQLRLELGSLTLVTGHSGSGKSTLGALLAGMLPRPGLDELSATFRMPGQQIEFSPANTPQVDPAGWAGHIGLLPQDAGHYLSGIRETVAEEIAFAMENAGVPRPRMRERVKQVAQTLQVGHLLERDPSRLSGGQRRLVALAALAVTEPRVLILDEPLAGLDEAAIAAVTAALARLRAQGVAIMVLSSSASRVRWPADASFELSRGTLQPTSDIPAAPAAHPALPGPARENDDTLLEVVGLELGYPGATDPVLAGLDLRVRAGQCLGLTGPNGAGKSSVLKAAAGLLLPRAGILRVTAPLGLLLQDPADQLFERTVRREVSFGLPKRGPGRARVDEVLALLDLAPVAEMHPYDLPASLRRLVALATVLVREPKLLLLDEPTEALDANGIRLLRSCIDRVTARGGAVVLATHDRAFLDAVAHRVQQLEDPARPA